MYVCYVVSLDITIHQYLVIIRIILSILTQNRVHYRITHDYLICHGDPPPNNNMTLLYLPLGTSCGVKLLVKHILIECDILIPRSKEP